MQNHEVAREKLFTMRMSADEWARFEALAHHYGLNVASTLRFLVKRDADSLGLGLPAPRSSAEAMARHHARVNVEAAGRLGEAVSARAGEKTKPAKKTSKTPKK